MIAKIKRQLLVVLAAAALLVPVAVPAVAGAQNQVKERLCAGANQAATGTEADCTDTTGAGAGGIDGAVDLIVDTFSWIVGIISVIMIIYGGMRYITSGGDSSKVTSAKNTIVYAIIGLVIVALAQFIVNFVVAKAVE